MSELKAYFDADRFATGIGIELLEVKEGYARARMEVSERHLNAAGVMQGGAIFTLADYAFAACSNSHGTLERFQSSYTLRIGMKVSCFWRISPQPKWR